MHGFCMKFLLSNNSTYYFLKDNYIFTSFPFLHLHYKSYYILIIFNNIQLQTYFIFLIIKITKSKELCQSIFLKHLCTSRQNKLHPLL